MAASANLFLHHSLALPPPRVAVTAHSALPMTPSRVHPACISCLYTRHRACHNTFSTGTALTKAVDSSASDYFSFCNFVLPVTPMAAARGGKAKSDEPHFDAPADVDVVATFEGMGLKQNLLRGIFEFGFEKPTAIQQRAIVPMTSGRDVIAQAQSGTGKTAMLSISALQVVNVHSREVQVLCLNPTRELAVQVTRRTQRPSNTCSNMPTDSQSCKRDRRCHEYPGAPLHRWKIHRRRYQAP
jgi:hypothetical protein